MKWGKLVTVVDNDSMQEWKVYEYRYIGPWTDSIIAIWGKKEIPLYYRGITEMSLSARHNCHGRSCRCKAKKGLTNLFYKTLVASGGTEDSSGRKLWDLKVKDAFFYYYRNSPKFSLKYISLKEAENMGPLNTQTAPGLNNYPIHLVNDKKSELEYVHQSLEKENLTLSLSKSNNKKDPSKSIYMYVRPATGLGESSLAKPYRAEVKTGGKSVNLGTYFSQEGAALAAARFKAESSDAN